MGRRYEITEQEWENVKDMLLVENMGCGRPSKPNRDMLNGIVWIAKSGASWWDLPKNFGAWQTVYERFTVWNKSNVFEKMFDIHNIEADLQDLSIDSTSCKVHQHAAGAKKRRHIPK